MVRITLFFVGGILLGIYQPDFISSSTVVVFFLFLILFYFVSFIFLREKSSLHLVSGFFGLAAIFLAGYLQLLNKTDSRSPDHFSRVQAPVDFYFGRATGSPEEKINSRKIEIEMIAVRSGAVWRNVTGKSLLYVSKKPDSPDLQYGDGILVRGWPAEIAPPGNPGELDRKSVV